MDLIILSGIDIVNNHRIKKLITRSPHTINEIFSKKEIEYCQKRKFPEQSFGARFAVKEALLKASDSDILEYDLSKIEIINTDSRKPILIIHIDRLNEKIKKLLNKEIFKINISLSHERDFSIAQVIIY